MRSFEPKGELPKGCTIVGVATFVVFLDHDQQEYLVPIEEVPDSVDLKEAILRNKVNALLKTASDYEMVRRILDTLGPCFT